MCQFDTRGAGDIFFRESRRSLNCAICFRLRYGREPRANAIELALAPDFRPGAAAGRDARPRGRNIARCSSSSGFELVRRTGASPSSLPACRDACVSHSLFGSPPEAGSGRLPSAPFTALRSATSQQCHEFWSHVKKMSEKYSRKEASPGNPGLQRCKSNA
jgi:hypothetical protein